ncbi:MAG: EF-P lysine aminoacylase GenX [Desulfobacterales bacterium]|nr:EF-P lysine aminoacylase GenX [Desulfobacterales bacterium]
MRILNENRNSPWGTGTEAPCAGTAARRFTLSRNLVLRAKVVAAIRDFFSDHAFLEVETPYRIPSPAPELHIDPEPSGEWCLHTSPELCMKRLLAAGHSRIFQICKSFRKKERGDRHLPEFTLLEWYQAGSDYLEMMDQTRALVRAAASSLGLHSHLDYQGVRVRLDGAWPRIPVAEAFERFGSMSMEEALARDRFDDVMACDIEPRLGVEAPVFLYDYPADRASLARLKQDNPLLAERFELYIRGVEMCNAFSELTDPAEQRRRFEQERREQERLGKSVYPFPEKFLAALRGMPRAAGVALGVDRLVMLLVDAPGIDDVTAFTPEEL